MTYKHECNMKYFNLLWVCLVHSSIHTYSDLQCPQTPVVLNSIQNGYQPCSHQVRGPERHYGADMLNSNTVVMWWAQIEIHEDVSGVLQTSFVPEMDRHVWYHLFLHRDHVTQTDRQVTYSSMAATCAVVIFPLVFKACDTCPSKSRPSLAIFSTTSLTNSPRYIPLTIFSKLHISKNNVETQNRGLMLALCRTCVSCHIMREAAFLTFVFQSVCRLHPRPCQTQWCNPSEPHHPQRPPTQCLCTSCPRLLPPGQRYAAPPCSTRWCQYLDKHTGYPGFFCIYTV